MTTDTLARACAQAINDALQRDDRRLFVDVATPYIAGAITRALEEREAFALWAEVHEQRIGAWIDAWAVAWEARHPSWERIDDLKDWAS